MGGSNSAVAESQFGRNNIAKRRSKIVAREERMKSDIGKRISIYSSKYDEWAPGAIVSIDAERRMHCVQYDNGDRRWHRMDMLKFQILHDVDSDTGVRA